MMSFAYIILIDEIYFNLKRKMLKRIFISFIDRMRRKACGIIEEKKRLLYDGVLYLPIV
jgi:hypothetical protein